MEFEALSNPIIGYGIKVHQSLKRFMPSLDTWILNLQGAAHTLIPKGQAPEIVVLRLRIR